MTNEIRQHIERSEHFIKVAEDLSKLKYWDNVISRTYYAMFHAVTAVLLNINIQRSSHHALIAAFGEHIAKMNLMDTKFHSTVNRRERKEDAEFTELFIIFVSFAPILRTLRLNFLPKKTIRQLADYL